jgi:hypothetical protein
VSETVWIKHPETGGVVEVPRDALAMYRQSGWDVLTDEEIAEREKAAADEAAAAGAGHAGAGRRRSRSGRAADRCGN